MGEAAAGGTVRSILGRLAWSEWAIVLAGFLVLLSAVLPTWESIRRRQRLAMARHDVEALSRAILRYQREYGMWPGESVPGGTDLRFGTRRSNAELIRTLRAEGPTISTLNPQRMVFIEVERYQKGWSGLDANGAFLDPWGTPYQVVLDTNYDNAAQVDNSVYGRVVGVGVLVWSCGPDRRSETKDDILSWRR